MGLTVLLYAGVPKHQLPPALRRKKGTAGAHLLRKLEREQDLANFVDSGVAGHLPEIGTWRADGRVEAYDSVRAVRLVEDLKRVLTGGAALPEGQLASVRELLDMAEQCTKEGLFIEVVPD